MTMAAETATEKSSASLATIAPDSPTILLFIILLSLQTVEDLSRRPALNCSSGRFRQEAQRSDPWQEEVLSAARAHEPRQSGEASPGRSAARDRKTSASVVAADHRILVVPEAGEVT